MLDDLRIDTDGGALLDALLDDHGERGLVDIRGLLEALGYTDSSGRTPRNDRDRDGGDRHDDFRDRDGGGGRK
jgi:hypothetical protein